ncbi:hypothetical protein Hanom_Chr04g00346161 [Helianthus anomalus]
MCYSQAMPMLWRVLYTLEQSISDERLGFNLYEFSHMYAIVSHGSHWSRFKSKPHQPLLILKTTKTTPQGRTMNNFAFLAELPSTEERIAAFLALDSTIRTFKIKAKDLEETTSTSFTMSICAPRSPRKSTSKLDLGDIDNMITPHSIKKELAKGQSQPEPKTMTTRAKT